MRSDARSKSSSSTSEEGKLYVKPNSPHSPSTHSEQVENVSSRALKRQRDENASSTYKKKKKKGGSGVDLEELLAQTYPKDSSTPPTAQDHFRRSTRRNHRPAKSAEVAKKWSGEEEMCVAEALLETSSADGEVKLNAFYERAREKVEGEISNSQLYDKMRNMSKRFRSIRSKLTEQAIPEERFAYRTPHERALFQMWKHIWRKTTTTPTSETEQPNTTVSQNEGPSPRVINADHPALIHSDNGGPTAGGESPEQHDEHLHDSQNPLPHQTLEENGIICCGSEVLEKNMKDMLGKSESRLQALIHSSFNCLVGLGFAGGCACLGLSRRMKELIDAVNYVEEFPGFSDEQAKQLQQKWRMHKIQEMKMFSECLGLLHSQCKCFLQNLEN